MFLYRRASLTNASVAFVRMVSIWILGSASPCMAETFDDDVQAFLWGNFWVFIGIPALAVGFVFFAASIPDLIRFGYEASPPPATDEVHKALTTGAYDPEQLSDALSYRPRNSIEREVRTDQAKELARLLSEQNAKSEAQIEQQLRYLQSCTDVAEAAELHQRLLRRLDTLRQLRGAAR